MKQPQHRPPMTRRNLHRPASCYLHQPPVPLRRHLTQIRHRLKRPPSRTQMLQHPILHLRRHHLRIRTPTVYHPGFPCLLAHAIPTNPHPLNLQSPTRSTLQNSRPDLPGSYLIQSVLRFPVSARPHVATFSHPTA